MSADLLRQAATILRNRAEAATPGPWSVAERRDKSICGIDQQGGYDDVIAPGRVECMAYCYGGTSTIEAEDGDWRYIATMHPGVGLALADLLDLAAEQCARDDLQMPMHSRLLPIARLIVGDA